MAIELISHDKRERGRVLLPADPEFLRITGQIHTNFEDAPAPPPREGEWRQDYRIFLTQGIWGREYQLGVLRIERGAGSGGGNYSMRVLQVTRDGTQTTPAGLRGQRCIHRLEAEIHCENNALKSWKLGSCLVDPEHELGDNDIFEPSVYHETAEVKGDRLIRTLHGASHESRLPSGSLKSEFNLLHEVPQYPFQADMIQKFVLLEGLSLPKTEQRVRYIGPVDWQQVEKKLHVFVHMGRGRLPMDFWFDSEHRLVAATTSNFGLAYIPEQMMSVKMHDFILEEFNTGRDL